MTSRVRALPSQVYARQSRRERKPVEESPDIAGRGGRETDPGKPAGKCHRKIPPMAWVGWTSVHPRTGKGEKVR